MYAESRPYPWESQMSSAAVNRTSTGNGRPSTTERSPAKASRTAARGSPYSISTKRTRRGVQNTDADGPVYVRADSARADTRFSGRTTRGATRAKRHATPNTRLERSSSSSQPRNRDSGASDTATRLLRLVSASEVYGNQ